MIASLPSMASAEEAQEEVQPTSPTIIGEQQGVRQRLPSQDRLGQRRRRFAGNPNPNPNPSPKPKPKPKSNPDPNPIPNPKGSMKGGGRTSGSYLGRLRENLRKPVVGAKNHLRLLVWLHGQSAPLAVPQLGSRTRARPLGSQPLPHSCSSQPPPESPISLPLIMQVWLLMGSVLFSAILCIFWHSLLSLTLNPKS